MSETGQDQTRGDGTVWSGRWGGNVASGRWRSELWIARAWQRSGALGRWGGGERAERAERAEREQSEACLLYTSRCV